MAIKMEVLHLATASMAMSSGTPINIFMREK